MYIHTHTTQKSTPKHRTLQPDKDRFITIIMINYLNEQRSRISASTPQRASARRALIRKKARKGAEGGSEAGAAAIPTAFF